MEWKKYRRSDRSIDLKTAYNSEHERDELTQKEEAFIKCIEGYHRIKSRQAAAIIFAMIEFGLLEEK